MSILKITIEEWLVFNIAIKIDGWYYVSPRYALKGKGIYIDVFCKMMNCDDLNDLCSRKDLFIINKYKKIKP